MTKSPDAFRTISEVADWLGIQAHVLRFWESKFTQVKPVKRAGGRRYYRPSDMLLIGGIKKLLHDDGLTIKGVQKLLREHGISHVSALSQSLDETAAPFPTGTPAAAQGDADIILDDTVVSFPDAVPIAEANPPQQIDLNLEPADPQPATPPLAGALLRDLETQDAEPDLEPAAPENPDQTAEPDQEDHPALVIPQIDAMDPPAHDQISFIPGPLAHLVKMPVLDAKNIAELTELAATLAQLNDQRNNVTTE